MTAQSIACRMRYHPLFAPLAWLTGMWTSRSGVTVEDGVVRVRMGWAFRAVLPVRAISSARAVPSPWWLGIGVHGLRGTWAANGSRRGTVEICLAPAQRARALGIPVRLERLYVSVQEPEALVAAVTLPDLRQID